jgi:hypothetical protein
LIEICQEISTQEIVQTTCNNGKSYTVIIKSTDTMSYQGQDRLLCEGPHPSRRRICPQEEPQKYCQVWIKCKKKCFCLLISKHLLLYQKESQFQVQAAGQLLHSVLHPEVHESDIRHLGDHQVMQYEVYPTETAAPTGIYSGF